MLHKCNNSNNSRINNLDSNDVGECMRQRHLAMQLSGAAMVLAGFLLAVRSGDGGDGGSGGERECEDGADGDTSGVDAGGRSATGGPAGRSGVAVVAVDKRRVGERDGATVM